MKTKIIIILSIFTFTIFILIISFINTIINNNEKEDTNTIDFNSISKINNKIIENKKIEKEIKELKQKIKIEKNNLLKKEEKLEKNKKFIKNNLNKEIKKIGFSIKKEDFVDNNDNNNDDNIKEKIIKEY